MNILKSIAVAFSMYSRIPMPVFEWKKENMKYSICFFPFVGLVITFLLYGIMCLFEAIPVDVPIISKTIFLLIIPVLVSGGIHLDGYMDTSDALSSFRDREKRLEILSDPHIGAFAVIRLAIFVSAFFASVLTIFSISDNKLVFITWGLCFFLSRVLSGIAVVSFKCAKKEGTLYTFAEGSEKTRCKIALYLELIICCVFLICFGRILGIIEIVVSLIGFLYYYHIAYKSFGGITGDLAGYFVCICELYVSLALMIGTIVMNLI